MVGRLSARAARSATNTRRCDGRDQTVTQALADASLTHPELAEVTTNRHH